ncbi:MAG: hypothetical protein PHV34_24200 [Verrucomicrobiae bacterium]|nr:hypothetical protein [Verrucomicrobiae bacterium]
MNNLRQIGVAFLEYANDFDGWLPLSYPINAGEPNWVYPQQIGRYVGIGGPNTVWVCASATSSEKLNGRTYGMNCNINLSKYRHRVDNINATPETVLVADNRGNDALIYDDSVAWANIAKRHNQGAFALYCDFHVAWRKDYPFKIFNPNK